MPWAHITLRTASLMMPAPNDSTGRGVSAAHTSVSVDWAVNADFAVFEKRREMDAPPAVAPSVDAVPWLLKVQCYLEFWEKFLQELALSKQHSCNAKALSLAASNVWGETRLSTREIYDSGPIVLVPEIFTSQAKTQGSAAADKADINAQWDHDPEHAAVDEEEKQTQKPQAEGSHLDSSRDPSTAAQEAPHTNHDSSVYETQISTARRPQQMERLGKRPMVYACDSDELESNYEGIRANSATTSSIEEEDEMQSDHLQDEVIDLSETTRSLRFRSYKLMRNRVLEALSLPSTSQWPPAPLPFPKKHLFYDPKQYPVLFKAHNKLWTRFSPHFLELVYMHPVNTSEQRHIYSTKNHLARHQAQLLSDCIETLGIQVVAQAFQKPEHAAPFFLAIDYIRLDELAPKDLEIHLRYVRTPWKSPELRKRTVTWWETLVQTRSDDSIALSARAKRLLANAHFRGLLVFDRKWLQMACKEPWKSMLEAYVVDSSDSHKKDKPHKSKSKHFPHKASKKLSVRRSAPQNEPEVLYDTESEDDSSTEREILNQLRRSKGRSKRVRYSV